MKYNAIYILCFDLFTLLIKCRHITITENEPRENKMKINIWQCTENGLNPVICLANDGTVLYSNVVGGSLLHEWNVRVGEKLPAYIGDFVQKVISQDSPEKMEVKVGKITYLVEFYPILEEESVDIYGFDI